MEQLQFAYVSAIAAASGCIIWTPTFDDGIDLTLTHEHDDHTGLADRTATLNVQLKATGVPLAKGATTISADMTHKRWVKYARKQPTTNKIVVIMSLPSDPVNWTLASHAELAVRHCAYWVNIAGKADSGAERPAVAAPLSQVFDDMALCKIMERIGKGQTP